MFEWLRKRSLPVRMSVYLLAAALAFAVSAGVGVTVALTLRGDLGLPEREEAQSPGEQEKAAPPQGKEANARQNEDGAPQQNEAEYVARVGDVQNKSVEAFLDSHDKMRRYDALTSQDIEQMRTNQATLQELAEQVDDLDPPEKYREQYEVFRFAINELREATQLAYSLAADPITATQSGFDEYDRHVNDAAAALQQSNELIDRDFKVVEDAPQVSPS